MDGVILERRTFIRWTVGLFAVSIAATLAFVAIYPADGIVSPWVRQDWLVPLLCVAGLSFAWGAVLLIPYRYARTQRFAVGLLLVLSILGLMFALWAMVGFGIFEPADEI